MRVDVLTIFPDYLAPLRLSLIGRAVEDGLIDLRVHDLRDWTTDRHRTVDDSPYGGGAGMLMRPEPWGAALDTLLSAEPDANHDVRVVIPTPSGEPFTQRLAHDLSRVPRLVFACGRYEGIDQRVLDDLGSRAQVTEVSLGDFVVNGGEVAALAVVEAVARLLPGVIGNAESLVHESHADGLLEGPAYTKPPEWRGRPVPDVLLSGNHAQIERWRRDESLRRTATRRPDLLEAIDPADFDEADLAALGELGWALEGGPAGRARLVRNAPPVAD
jgi:tRNA (guanine37-N1)-methyltransferase